MALINKIRERSGLAIGIIALALGAFVVLGDFVTGQNSLFNKGQVVGEIAGEKIDYNEFQAELNQVERNFQAQSGKAPSEAEMPGLRDQAWNNLLFRIAFKKEFERLGLAVTDAELTDMVQGNNVHPSIKQSFTDPKTKQFDRAMVVNYLKNFDKLQPEQQAMWNNFEQNLGPERMRTKFDNLMKMSNYVTAAEAKHFNEAQNAKVSMKYLMVPYFAIPDSTVKVTDEELETYLSKHKNEFKAEEGRSITYVTIPVAPSGEDSASVRKDMEELATQFRASENDSLFVRANSDAPFNASYVGLGELPAALKDAGMPEKGKVYGPMLDGTSFKMYKVIGEKSDSTYAARASHILIKPSAETDEAKAEALKKAKDILAKIKGGASFEEMARAHGTDGTASQGGDLGWFDEKRMVPEFSKAIFGASGTGLLPEPVKTQFGYHVIKITAPKTNKKYQLATIERSISASDETKDAAFRKADLIAGTSKNTQEFEANVAKEKTLTKAEAKNLDRAGRQVNNLANARELVRWAYNDETQVGNVSPVFEVDDFFVIATLTGKREKGNLTAADMKDELTAKVRNEKKAAMIMQKIGSAGTLEEMAKKYGAEAKVETMDNVTFGSQQLEGIGQEPEAIGKAFALKKGGRTKPFAGQNGVMALELVETVPAPPAGDIAAIRKQMEQQKGYMVQNNVFEAIKANAAIKDNRSKYF